MGGGGAIIGCAIHYGPYIMGDPGIDLMKPWRV